MMLQKRRQSGFSLIELLVVMAIIAILTSLLMAAVQRSRVAGLRTENGARIHLIGESMSRCKGDLKLDYIPSHPMNTTVAPGAPGAPVGFVLKGIYNGNEPELAILTRAFPNMNHALNPDPNTGDTSNGFTPLSNTGDILDSNQVLCLFLTGGLPTNFTGFSNNPRKPFLAAASGGETRKGPWVQHNEKLFLVAPNGHPWIIDVYGVPYAYFASVGGKINNYNYGSPPVTQTFTTPAGAFPIATFPNGNPGTGTVPYTNGSKFVNENGYQLISAGYDKKFGPGGVLPAMGTPGGVDDQANFSKAQLGAGIN